MKFVITAGGTAGHINPALALAEKLTKLGHDVFFAGTPNRLESKLVPQAGYDFVPFEAYGFNRKHPLSLVKALSSLEKSTKAAKKWLVEIKPNAVIGFGCYVSLSICRAAKSLKIPYIVHEQNSVMGIANKQLSKYASATCLTYKEADTGRCNNVIVCGNPVRSNFFSATKTEGRNFLNIPEDAFVLLVFGGSLGAEHINNAILSIAETLLTSFEKLFIVQVTGKNQYDIVVEKKSKINLSSELSKRYIVYPYLDRMADVMAASDLCISRAGASSLAEITASALPSLLIPYPLATENHQYHNAKSLMESGCVMYINDDDLLEEDRINASTKFKKLVKKMVEDKQKLLKMRESYKKFDATNAVNKLTDVVLDCAKK